MFYTLQAANVLNIAFFKYFYLFADFIGRIAGIDEWLDPGLRHTHRLLGEEILLPLAISFYTFQIMSYGIDIYRGTYEKVHTFIEVLLFKTFFPQLIAGPIMRAQELLPQIQSCTNNSWVPEPEKFRRGAWLIIAGLVKKMIIAEEMTVFAAPLLSSNPVAFNGAGIWISLIGAIFMLYADFSAYTDLARGFGLFMGFEIPRNFKAPLYFSSLSDFWTKWHITFSRWIRDYIFIPLGGSRVAEWRVYLNLTITFFLGGLWHGASYTFVVWGTLMGIWLSAESFMNRRGIPGERKALKGIQALSGYIIWIMSGAFFFSKGMGWTWKALGVMMNPVTFIDNSLRFPSNMESFYGAFIAVAFFHWADENYEVLQRVRKYESWLLPLAALALIITLTQYAGSQKDFFYFQF